MWNEYDYGGRNSVIFHDHDEEQKWSKNEAAFAAKTGVCYTDRKGKEYCCPDFLALVPDAKECGILFEGVKGSPPKDYLDRSRDFVRCGACGKYHYAKDQGWLNYSKDVIPCPYCRPVKTHGLIPAVKDPYQDDRVFTKKKEYWFSPGLTTLIGCNGAGKTTLLTRIRDYLQGRQIPCLFFDNLGKSGGQQSVHSLLEMATSGMYNDKSQDMISNAVTLMGCSEGERIRVAFTGFASHVNRKLKEYEGYGEVWVLFDALDSGLSVDAMEEMKSRIFNVLLASAPEGMDLYLVATSNSYEFSEGTKCFSVAKGQNVPVFTYAGYKKEILESRAYKDDRDLVLVRKSEIAGMPEKFEYNASVMNLRRNREKLPEGEHIGAFMEKGDYRMEYVVQAGKRGGSGRRFCRLYQKQAGGSMELVPGRGVSFDWGNDSERDLRRGMQEYLENRIFKDQRKKSRKPNAGK